MSLENKKIILGICGGIAAYKTVELVSQLKKRGAHVYVVLTDNASKFVSSLSLEVMSGNKVYSGQIQGENIDHIQLADIADLILIAPATANALAKMANGISDSILFDIVLATKAPIMVAPAMNTNMWLHPSTRNNLEILKSFHYQIIEPESGDLACGHVGPGRLADIENILKLIEDNFKFTSLHTNSPFHGKKIVITVGGTRERLDPVRYISNRSSGTMGFALAREASQQGASVVLISTINNQEAWINDTQLVQVETHAEMQAALEKEFDEADITIMVAAVADFRPTTNLDQKVKKIDGQDTLVVEMEKTPDILAGLGKRKKSHQVTIGFSVETERHLEKAQEKLKRKNLDFIVVNSPEAFASQEAQVTIMSASEKLPAQLQLAKQAKTELAKEILKYASLCLGTASKDEMLKLEADFHGLNS